MRVYATLDRPMNLMLRSNRMVMGSCKDNGGKIQAERLCLTAWLTLIKNVLAGFVWGDEKVGNILLDS